MPNVSGEHRNQIKRIELSMQRHNEAENEKNGEERAECLGVAFTMRN